MKITRVYTGDDGESHFEDIEVPLVDRGKIGWISNLETATGIVFRETDANPLVTTKISKHVWFGSASVDVDIASFIGNIGKLFGQ